MLGFILSKMNLLILVAAIFAIIGFFTIGLADIIEVNEANNLAKKLREKFGSLSSGSSLCLNDRIGVPEEFFIAGKSFFYVLKISKKEISPASSGSPAINSLIFAIYPRKEIIRENRDTSYKAKAIAADSFRTTAELKLFSRDYILVPGSTSMDYDRDTILTEVITVDPQAITPMNQIEIVRQVVDGKPTLYLINCSRGGEYGLTVSETDYRGTCGDRRAEVENSGVTLLC